MVPKGKGKNRTTSHEATTPTQKTVDAGAKRNRKRSARSMFSCVQGLRHRSAEPVRKKGSTRCVRAPPQCASTGPAARFLLNQLRFFDLGPGDSVRSVAAGATGVAFFSSSSMDLMDAATESYLIS